MTKIKIGKTYKFHVGCLKLENDSTFVGFVTQEGILVDIIDQSKRKIIEFNNIRDKNEKYEIIGKVDSILDWGRSALYENYRIRILLSNYETRKL
jgi:hypothetical protein